jgi:hypothetical protein
MSKVVAGRWCVGGKKLKLRLNSQDFSAVPSEPVQATVAWRQR